MSKTIISLLGILMSGSLLAAGITIQTSGAPTYPMGGKFYGYRSSGQGPGDTAFDDARALAEKNNVLLFIVWGKDGCSTCSQYISNLDAWSRAAPKMLSYKNSINAYFRGRADGTGPAACVACYNFLRDTVDASGSCHIMAAYGVCEDGTVYKKSCSLITDYTASGTKKVAWCDEFEALKKKHPRQQTKSDVAFECGTNTNTRLEATRETERVFVPFIRTNNIDRAALYKLRVTFPNGQPVDIDMDWTNGQERAEVDLYMTGRYQQDERLQLVIVNTNDEEVATNFIHCVGPKVNSFEYPQYAGETNGYSFGTWTLDYDLATNAVTARSGCLLKVTGSPVWNAQTIAFKGVFDSDDFKKWCVSNNVALVLNETAEPETGASLLSHKIAVNKTSGTPYISSKGVSALDDEWNPIGAKLPVGGEFKVELIRPDGTVLGRLTPQFDADGTCDAAENVARLVELMQEDGDRTEAANDGTETSLTFQWGETKNSQTLAISDREDSYKLTDTQGWSGKKVVFEITGENARPEAQPSVEVLVDGTVVEPEVTYLYLNNQIIAETNYAFTAAAIQNGKVIVRAKAFDGAAATTNKFGGNTRFGYTLTARQMRTAPGVVSFVDEGDYVTQDTTNKTYRIYLTRLLGSSGSVSATVTVDDSPLTTATNMYAFTQQTVAWGNGETDAKFVDITLLGSNVCEGVKTIVLKTNVETVPGVEVAQLIRQFSISYGQEPTDEGKMGIEILRTEPLASDDGRIYVRHDAQAVGLVRADVYRTGGKGPAVGYLTVTAGGKALDKATFAWPNYGTGSQTMIWGGDQLPAPDAKAGYTDATIKLTTSNNFPVAKGYDKIDVRVLRGDAPAFANEAVIWNSAVQYVAFSNAVDMTYGEDGVRALPAGWTVVGATRLTGALPAGLKESVDKKTGALLVTGTPTKPVASATSVWWMKFKDQNGKVVMSSPVTLTISVTALAKDETTGEGLIPGFDEARSWTGLPLVDAKTKRLDGLLDMTVAKNGRTTARWRKAGGKTVSFSAASLTGSLQHKTAGTNVSVKVEKTSGGVRNTFGVYFWTDGRVTGQATEYNVAGKVVAYANITVPAAKVWSKENPADAWAGDYTLAFPHDGEFAEHTLCTGPTTLRVKFDTDAMLRTGKAAYAGTLPNGKSVSGTAALVPTTNGAEKAELPIFFSSATDTFGALVALPSEDDVVAQVSGATNFWSHVENRLPEASYDNEYGVVGMRYEPDDLGTATWDFLLDGIDTGARVKANGMSLSVVDKGDVALTFQLNKTSGVTAGAFKADVTGKGCLTTVNWRGVAFPGTEALMLGAYSFTTNVCNRSVKAGGEVMLAPVR